MIELSRLNGKKFVLNCELIKFIEATPDTVITLTTGDKLMVLEPVDQVIRATVAFRQNLLRGPMPGQGPPTEQTQSPEWSK
jgi:flagellar protein FlbD